MRFTAVILSTLVALAVASPALDKRATLCSCVSTTSCGCNSVVPGSYCVCAAGSAGGTNAAPCQDNESCGCYTTDTWGVCEVRDASRERRGKWLSRLLTYCRLFKRASAENARGRGARSKGRGTVSRAVGVVGEINALATALVGSVDFGQPRMKFGAN
jgi:hypothetical protein